MAQEFALTFDLSAWKLSLENFGKKSLGAMGKALYVEGNNIINDSKRNYVPVDFGTLRDSGTVEAPEIGGTSVQVTIGFGGPAARYAAVIHENPRAGKTSGLSPQGKKYKHWATTGGFKYLELPMNAAKSGFVDRVGGTFWSEIEAQGLK